MRFVASAYVTHRDRVGPAGLRPQTLPHHRTCRFQHPAIEPSNYSIAASVDGTSINCSCIALFQKVRSSAPSEAPSCSLQRLHRPANIWVAGEVVSSTALRDI